MLFAIFLCSFIIMLNRSVQSASPRQRTVERIELPSISFGTRRSLLVYHYGQSLTTTKRAYIQGNVLIYPILTTHTTSTAMISFMDILHPTNVTLALPFILSLCIQHHCMLMSCPACWY